MKKDSNNQKEYSISVKLPDGSWKEIDMDKLPKTAEEWEAHFKKKNIAPSTFTEFLKYQFTHDEIHQKGADLARINSELSAIQGEKKAVAANFKAKEDAKQAEIDVISNHINNGYEHRYIKCFVIYNSPNTGMKQIIRNDTAEVVKMESMTAEEMQFKLDLKEETVTE
jgi:hypothetical protein